MLSKRLLEISKLVDKNKTVYDVGSDHGLLPCFLVSEGITKKAYCGDNKQGPLNNAKKNINKFHLDGFVFTCLSDGIENIPCDVDIIVIAGMGYFTVKHILENKDLSRFDKIIVQVNKDTDLLRRFISDNNYSILDEKVVYDDFYYEIVVFNCNRHDKYNEEEIKYGPILLENKDSVFIDYLKYKKSKLIDIYNNSKNNDILNAIKEIDDILM